MDNYIDPQAAIRTAKLLSAASSLLVGGYSLAFSQNNIPALYDQRPQSSVPAFRSMCWSASAITPPLALLSTSTSAYLAYALPEQRREWTTAAVAMASTFLWTGLVMVPGIGRLMAISEDKDVMLKSEQNLEHRQLLIRWVKQNYVTVTLKLVSGVVALRAIVAA